MYNNNDKTNNIMSFDTDDLSTALKVTIGT